MEYTRLVPRILLDLNLNKITELPWGLKCTLTIHPIYKCPCLGRNQVARVVGNFNFACINWFSPNLLNFDLIVIHAKSRKMSDQFNNFLTISKDNLHLKS
jgi:hypothetical protein